MDGAHSGRLILQALYQKRISFAQNQEDILLDRVLNKPDGFYVDIGANDPEFHSVTKLMYDKGWSGINVEPNPVLHRRLCDQRPRDVNLNAGVSNADGTLTFYDVKAIHGWSTFEPAFAENYRKNHGLEVVERPIPVRTLAAIFDEHVDREVDFLKIDVEGFERQALEGADFDRWRPRIVLLEATWPDAWEPILIRAAYPLATFDGLNRYYVREEEPELAAALKTPVNVMDNWISADYLKLFEQVGVLPPELGRNTIELIRKMKSISRRHPRLTKVAKRILRMAG
jgi:FkbM family methyltransferase